MGEWKVGMNTPIGLGLGEALGEGLITPALPEGGPEPQLEHPTATGTSKLTAGNSRLARKRRTLLMVIEEPLSLNADPARPTVPHLVWRSPDVRERRTGASLSGQ
jgi:hypothetical protein